jgi:hypothetical protein
MPFKEIITYGIGIAMVAGLAGNPLHFRENLRRVQFQVLKECTRVDNWGNPSPWAHRLNHVGLNSSRAQKAYTQN